MIDIEELRRRVRTGDHNPIGQRPAPAPTARRVGFSQPLWWMLIIFIIVILVALNRFSERSQATYYVTRLVNVRDKPQKDGSVILTSLTRGTPVIGEPTGSVSDRSTYLAVSSGTIDRGYVWMVNLANHPLPELISGRYSFSVGTWVWAMRAPDSSSEKLEQIKPDQAYFASGDLASGWVEVEIPTGGIGYIPKQEVQQR